MTEKDLGTKIQEISQKIPGIEDRLKSSRLTPAKYSPINIEDVQYAETERYKLVGSKWHEEEEHTGAGIEWSGYTTLHYVDKEEDKQEIKEEKGQTITIRHHSDSSLDRKGLRGYHSVGMEILDSNKVELYWTDKEGNKGPSEQFELE